jgi:hypothetical protein
MNSYVKNLEGELEVLAANKQLTLPEAQALRQRIDESINFLKKQPELKGSQAALYEIRTALRDKMNDAINLLEGAGKDSLKKANLRYSNLAKAQELAEKQIARDANNRAISLTDTIAGAAGASSGNPLLTVALPAVNKFGRTFGNAIMARSADSLANVVASGSKKLERVAAQHPKEFQVLVAHVANKVMGKPYFDAVPEADIFKDDNIQQLLRENPKILDNIQNETLKAQLYEKLQRDPSSSDNPMKRRLNKK